MRNHRHIMGFLDAKGAQHGKAAAADEHRVTVISVNRQCFSSERSTRDVNDGGQQLTGNLVQIGNVEQ